MKLFLLMLVCIAFFAMISCNDSGTKEEETPADSAAMNPPVDSVTILQPDSASKIDSATTGDPTRKKFKPGAVKIAADTTRPR